MKKIKYLILGAGPSGLTIAHSLIHQGIPQIKQRMGKLTR